MILVDTSVWVDHLRKHSEALADLLEKGAVLAHPFVIGELALGPLRQREIVLTLLAALPCASIATESEVLQFIGRHALFSQGVGYVDVHLVAATLLTANARLWTSDRKLHGVATELRLAATPPFDISALS